MIFLLNLEKHGNIREFPKKCQISRNFVTNKIYIK